MNGFITWPRDMESSFTWYTTPNTLVLFVHLLTKANIKASFFAGKRIERGCVVTSTARLSEETGLTDKQVRIAIDHLAESGDIVKETSNRFTLLRITNFDRFNGGEQGASEGQAEGEPGASRRQHNEKDEKGDKEEKKEDASLSETVKSVVDAWNEQCGSSMKISRISPQSTRYKSLAARIDEHGIDAVLKAVENVSGSSFLKEATWFSFDWFVKPNNFIKVLDGNYNDRRSEKKAQQSGAKADEVQMTDADRQRVRDDYSARMMRGDY